MISLRRTALLWMTGLLALVGIVAFAISYELALQEAAGFLDGQLRQIALNAGSGMSETTSFYVKHDPEDDFVIAIWAVDGKIMRQSDSRINLQRQTRLGFATIHEQGEDWRVFLTRDRQRFVQVAQRMSIRKEMAESAALQAGIPLLVVIPLAWLLIGWALRQILGRVSRLARSIAERSIDAREPIPAGDMPAEVRPLVDAMNVLAGRLQHAVEEQKRFVADAAHELRTPLTALNLQLENLWAQTPENNAELVAELGGGIRRVSTLVEQLLRLARSDENLSQTRPVQIDLTELVTTCIADFMPIAAAKNIDLGITYSDDARLLGWPADLRALFGNILDNAIRYTPADGSVDVSIRASAEMLCVEISDTGIGVDEKDIPRLFDRFFRSAPLDIDGNGLGLSIAAAVARRHGLSIFIANRTARSGLIVRVLGKNVGS